MSKQCGNALERAQGGVAGEAAGKGHDAELRQTAVDKAGMSMRLIRLGERGGEGWSWGERAGGWGKREAGGGEGWRCDIGARGMGRPESAEVVACGKCVGNGCSTAESKVERQADVRGARKGNSIISSVVLVARACAMLLIASDVRFVAATLL
jgi:hypothetical protein